MSAATSSRSCATWSRSRIALTRERKRKDVQARAAAGRRGARGRRAGRRRTPAPSTKEAFRKKLRAGELNDKEIEIEVQAVRRRHADVRNPRHAGRADGRHLDRRHLRQDGRRPHQDAPRHRAGVARDPDQPRNPTSCSTRSSSCRRRSTRSRRTASCSSTRSTRSPARDGRVGGDVSREGVQRDLLPLIEGTTVSTKHGAVKTDHILFIASGAFHVSKPSDLLPELQGRLPIRVELQRAHARRLPPHPDRARGVADQAVRRADGDRGRDARIHRRTPSTPSPTSRWR